MSDIPQNLGLKYVKISTQELLALGNKVKPHRLAKMLKKIAQAAVYDGWDDDAGLGCKTADNLFKPQSLEEDILWKNWRQTQKQDRENLKKMHEGGRYGAFKRFGNETTNTPKTTTQPVNKADSVAELVNITAKSLSANVSPDAELYVEKDVRIENTFTKVAWFLRTNFKPRDLDSLHRWVQDHYTGRKIKYDTLIKVIAKISKTDYQKIKLKYLNQVLGEGSGKWQRR